MIENHRLQDWDDGYIRGYEEGRQQGHFEGFAEASGVFEERINRLNVELMTLNARIDYLNSVMDKQDNGLV